MTMFVLNLVTPEATTKLELLFNLVKTVSEQGLLNI
jgi:hypothetical protein